MEKKAKNKHGFMSMTMYGMGEFFNGGAFVIINAFFIVFMTNAMGIPAYLAGMIPLVGKVWDAVTDPIMGNITDRTTSKFGAKRFYILIGAFLSSITFVLMWLPFSAASVGAEVAFYMVMYCLFSTGFTVLMVPYGGLLPDMVEDYVVRSKFSNVRMIWSTLGSMVCGLVPTFMIKDNTNSTAYLTCAILFGFLFLITSLVTFVGTWEKDKEPVVVPIKDSFRQAVGVFKSRSFRLFIGIYLTGQCATDFVSGMAIYYVDVVLNRYQDGMLTILMGVLIVSQLIGMLIWGPVMTKTSKRMTILIGSPIRIISTLGLVFFSFEGAAMIPILICTAGIGIGNAATLTSIFAIMADMPDVDELITSVSRPGTVSGMATFARKISAGLSSGMIGILLSIVGYDASIAQIGERQAVFTQSGIAWIYILMPVILVVALLIFGYKFPMSEKEFDVIHKEIARRKGEDDSVATDEEKRICEEVTGFAYDELWNKGNI
ncbi:MAG: MFS transporter [Eubacteriales bacterium]|nr:MFS transporter [Eubacteriales bacterium]MDY3332730.1 MFS transporter [Gallibacter sp.]